jgi:hypothetical protein
MLKRDALVALLLLAISSAVSGAAVTCRNNENWWIGMQASLRAFINFPSVAISPVNTPAVGIEGTSTYTGPDGNIWFFTEGFYLYDMRSGAPVVVSNSLPSDQSNTNPGLIISAGNDIFFLFTNNADMNVIRQGTISLFIFTAATLPAGIISSTPLLTESVEGAIVLSGSNQYTFWYCAFIGAVGNTNTVGTASLSCVEFNPTGVLRIVSNPAFGWNCGLASSRGVLKYHEASNELIVGIGGRIYAYNFDAATGLISNPVLLVQNAATGYSAELSPDGTKLYYVVGSFGWNGNVYQLDRNTMTETQLSSKQNLIRRKLCG